MEKKYSWFKIADLEGDIAFNTNNLVEIIVNGKSITFCRHQEKIFAFASKCPHAGGIMAAGWVDIKGNVVCPVHGYRFNISTGRNTTGEGYTLKHWPVECRPEGIFVGMEDGMISSF